MTTGSRVMPAGILVTVLLLVSSAPTHTIQSRQLTASSVGDDGIDLSMVSRIKHEALVQSRVMDHAFMLTDVHGSRLTGSSGFLAAAEWIETTLSTYGLSAIQREPLDWGRGWTLDRFRAELISPQYTPLSGMVYPWSPGTDGEVQGEPLLAVFSEGLNERSLQEYTERYKGQLRDRILLMSEPRALQPDVRVPMARLSQEDLNALTQQAIPATAVTAAPATSTASRRVPFQELADQFVRFLNREGARLLVYQEFGKGGGVLEADRPLGSNWLRHASHALPPPMIVLGAEDYNRVARLLRHAIPTRIAVDVRSRITEPAQAFNLLADIQGTDKADELVMIGAHFDSWTGATGATDNAAGVAVMMEAMRVLKAVGAKPRRTIRLALWGGHEGEGFGARTHVRARFGTATVPLSLHDKISCYFNLDNGTGRIRGVYLQQNEAAAPIFRRWFEPFATLGASTLSMNSVGGTDHVPFDEARIPGFQFIQDPIEYATRTHHTNMDTYDRLQEADLKQAATIVASFALMAANRESPLPRKPLR